MRHETCLACRYGGDAAGLRPAVELAELISPDMHHHHAMSCEGCRAWWFDDVTYSTALGVPVPARRESVMCPCPEDGSERFTPGVIMVPEPESACRCDVALVDRLAVRTRTGGRS